MGSSAVWLVSKRVAKRARAHQVAARIVETHGNTITVEDCQISTWARLWGKRIALFSPGMLVAALARECAAAGGALQRAGTRSTALSQLAPVLWSAGDLLTGGKLDKVKRCANPECGWLFLDDSRAGKRRWCSMQSCGNRAKAKRHYHRSRED